MPEGSAGDLFDPRRLRKLWERTEEDPFEKREREEAELRETEPAISTLDLFQEIVRTCRRKLGSRVAPLEPLFKEARGLLAMKLAVERNEAAPAPAPAAPAAEAPAAAAPGPASAEAAPGAGKPAVIASAQTSAMGSLDRTDQDRADVKVKNDIARAMRMAGLDKVRVEKPVSQPAELSAALDAIEDLFDVLSYGPRRGPAAADAEGGHGRGSGYLEDKIDQAVEVGSDAAESLLSAEETT